MSKLSKDERYRVILNILNEDRKSHTAQDILKKLNSSGVNASLTTIKKDLKDLLKSDLIHQNKSTKESFSVRPGYEFNFNLSNEEATYLMVVLPGTHPINQRIRKIMGLV
jgi:Fe2+ or Zn2+ uptake regulation protein